MIKTTTHCGIKKYQAQKSYELCSQIGEKFIVYGSLREAEVSIKVVSQRSHQVGYIPKEIIHPLDEL